MKAAFKTMTRKQLEKLRTDVDAAIKGLDAKDKMAALKAAQAAAKAHGFSLAELTGVAAAEETPEKTPAKAPRAKKAGDGRAKVAPKYRNPNNAEETWSGRGRSPKWMSDHLKAGGHKEDFLI